MCLYLPKPGTRLFEQKITKKKRERGLSFTYFFANINFFDIFMTLKWVYYYIYTQLNNFSNLSKIDCKNVL